jgi:trk system potassium uptake protein TrkH
VNIYLIIKVLSFLVMLYSLFMIFPGMVAVYYDEMKELKVFLLTILFSTGSALLLYFFVRKVRTTFLSTRDGFFLVTMTWLLAAAVGSIPFFASGAIPSFTDSFFESISGLSTTGASILTDIESLPKSIIFWRSLNHWLGGMGIVVLAVAILPLLGIGGLQLVQAEAPGPTVDKITPRISETAKRLWLIYTGFTVLETVMLILGGMNLYEALIHTFGTLATGGFSSKNASVGHYNSAYIDWVITGFMILAGINFTLHYRVLTGRVKSIFRDTELKAYLLIFSVSTIIIAVNLYGSVYNSISEAFRYAGFQSASIMTTTGFATADYEKWPYICQVTIFLLMFVGGCSGSTGGGIKVFRLAALFKQAINEMKYLIHPRGVFTLKMSGHPVGKVIVFSVSGFFFLYIVMLLLTSAVVAGSGHDLLTSFSTALATVGNIGPGFGAVGPVKNYAGFENHVKWFLSFAMLVGRLELYTVLILFLPGFWKK